MAPIVHPLRRGDACAISVLGSRTLGTTFLGRLTTCNQRAQNRAPSDVVIARGATGCALPAAFSRTAGEEYAIAAPFEEMRRSDQHLPTLVPFAAYLIGDDHDYNPDNLRGATHDTGWNAPIGEDCAPRDND